MPLLTLKNVSKKEKETYTVKPTDFMQEAFQQIAIAGETGSGKTTLLKMIAGLVQPDSGEIYLNSERVLGPNDKLLPGHKHIAYLSQHFELRNNYYVHELLDYANKLTDEEAFHLYEICTIEHLLGRRTDQLSGGEKQRIALAKLLITSPRLLLLDEPFSNLDMMHRTVIKKVIHDIGEKLGITCMMVSHDPEDILSWADTIFIMKDGEIMQRGTAEEIYRKPLNEYCAGLFGEYNIIDSKEPNLRAAFSGLVVDDKKGMVRPEHILLQHKSGEGIDATVKKIFFCGNHYAMEVLVGSQPLKVYLNKNEFSEGEPVKLRLAKEDVWYF